MILIGDKRRFAIETGFAPQSGRKIATVYGLFRIWIDGLGYGIDQEDATCLANSYEWLKYRLDNRGTFVGVDWSNKSVQEILGSARYEIYGRIGATAESCEPFRRLMMAPDGDEAFDDGSTIIQFDVNNVVRLVAGRTSAMNSVEALDRATYRDEYSRLLRWEPGTLRDITFDADVFYDTIRQWLSAFECGIDVRR